MTSDDIDAMDGALTEEVSRLREELRSLHDYLVGTLRRDLHHNAQAADTAERRVRVIVLRLTQIERERIELNIRRAR